MMRAICLLIAIAFIQCSWGALSFSPPVTVHRVADEDVLNPQLALHPTDFSAVVVWVSQKESIYEIQGSFFDGSNWNSPSLLGSSQHEPTPRLKIDGNGNAIAIWDEFDGMAFSLRAAHFNSSIWSSAFTLQNLGSVPYSALPNLAINDTGFAIATWLSPALQLFGKTFNSTTSFWSDSYPISEDGFLVSQTVFAPLIIEEDNQVTVILPLEDRIDAAIFDALNPPNPPVELFLRTVVCEATTPSILQNSIPESLAFFVIQDTASNYLVSASIAVGGGWNFLLAANPGSEVENLTSTLHPSNNRAAIGWQKSTGAVQVAFYNYVSWLFTKTLSTAGTSPSLSFYQDTSDHLAVVWADQQMGDGNHSAFFSEYAVSTNSWTSAVSISETSASIGAVRSASLMNGSTIGVWTRLDETVGPTPRMILEASVGVPMP